MDLQLFEQTISHRLPSPEGSRKHGRRNSNLALYRLHSDHPPYSIGNECYNPYQSYNGIPPSGPPSGHHNFQEQRHGDQFGGIGSASGGHDAYHMLPGNQYRDQSEGFGLGSKGLEHLHAYKNLYHAELF